MNANRFNKIVSNRREFFRAAFRYGVLAVIVTIAARLAGRSKLRCVSDGVCGGCSRFAGCDLPPALSARSILRRPKHE